MSRFGSLRILVPPAVVPLALWVFVALAGPGGAVELGDEVAATSGSTDVGDDVGSISESTDDSTGGGGEAGCFLTVLADGANSYMVLQEHVSEPEMPQGGVAGNQNALDKICFGTVDGSKVNTTLVPGKSGDAPGQSGDAPGQTGDAPGKSGDAPGQSGDVPGRTEDTSSANQTATGPGKSEQAPGEPMAGGQAQGEGQEKADANGNGPAEAPGQNKPANDNKP